MAWIDLDEWESDACGGLLSTRRFARLSWPEGQHMRGRREPLSHAVREHVREQTGVSVSGPVRLLTQLRCFGYYFSPLNLFYCYDNDGEQVAFVVAEVSNTPWGEQHHYTLWEGNRTDHSAGLRFRHPKAFHVSPFMGMQMDYRWALTEPSESLRVCIDNMVGDDSIFHASMDLQREPLTKGTLNRLAIRFPWMTATLFAAIYWQALKLWWKKCPYHSHPKNQQQTSPV